MTNDELIHYAIKLAANNVSNGGGPFGAVIARNGEFIAEGVNRVTSTHDPTAHAEILAIRNAATKLGTFELSGCDIYTSCEPCPMCLGAIYWARLSHIYFAATKSDAATAGFNDAFIYHELSLPYNQRSLPTTPFHHEEELLPFEKWKNDINKIAY